MVKNTEAEIRFCALFLENEHLDYLLLTSEQVDFICHSPIDSQWVNKDGLPADCFNKLAFYWQAEMVFPRGAAV